MRKMHQLVRAHHLLQNHQDPDVAFAMSKDQVVKYRKIRKEFGEDLRLSKRKLVRERQIEGMKETLMEEGIPYWVQI